MRGKRQSRDGDPLVKKENVYEEDTEVRDIGEIRMRVRLMEVLI